MRSSWSAPPAPCRSKRALLLAGVVAWLGATGCNAILGISDLPAAKEAGASDSGPGDSGRSDGSRADASHTDATRADATRHDAGPGDSSAGDATDAPRADGGATDATTHEAAPPPPAFEVTPTTLAFGDAGPTPGLIRCGNAVAPTRQLTLTNHGTSALSWWSSLGLGAASSYTLSASCTPTAPCTLQSGDAGTRVVTVTGPLVPAGAGMTSYNDTLTVFSTAPGDRGTSVALQASSYGAVLAFSESDLNFGQQPANQPDGGYPQPLQLDNSGNAPFAGNLTIGGPLVMADGGATDGATADAGPSEFRLTQVAGDASAGHPGAIDVAAAGTTTFTVAFDPVGNAKSASGTLALGPPASAGLCAPLPGRVTLEGQGTSSPIAVTSSLNFNQGPNANNGVGISCGLAGSPLNVVVTNSSATPATVKSLTLGLGASSPFSVPATTPTITIPAATATGPGSVSIPVTPGSIPATATPGATFNDQLTVSTTAVGDLPHAVTLQMTAAGVVLAISANSVVVGTARQGASAQTFIFVTNTGNVPLQASQVTASTTNPVFTWQLQNMQAYAPQPAQFLLRFQPATTETYTGQGELVVNPGVPICSPPNGAAPAFNGTLKVALTGYGVGSQVLDQAMANPVIQLKQSCAVAGAQGVNQTATVTLANKADPKTVSWTAALTGPDAAFFTLSAIGGSLAPLGSTTVTVTGLGLSSSSGLTAQESAYGLNAAVTFTLTGTDTEGYSFPITEVAEGAYLAWSTSGVTVPAVGSGGFSLLNWSPLDATVTLTSGSAAFPLHLTNGNYARFGRPIAATIIDNGAATGATTTITASLPATQALCGPIPPPLPVSLATGP